MADKRRSKREENPVVEWISDNLRYIELIAIIVVVIIAAIFIIRAVRGRGAGTTAATSNSASVSAENNNSVKNTDNAVASSSAKDKAKETVVSSSSGESVKSTSSVSSSSTEESGLTQDNGAVSASVSDYFSSLLESGQNPEIESYSDITTYVYPGKETGAYVVFAKYSYKYKDYEEEIPALTALYVTTDASGNPSVVTDLSDAQSQAIDQAAQSQAGKALISDVQRDYDRVVGADQALADYISSLDE